MNTNNITYISVGSRASRLAQAQVQEVFSLLEDRGITLSFDLQTFKTQGDEDKTMALSAEIADDFFTDSVDQALLDGNIDIGIHSAKDLPEVLKEGLRIFALTKSVDETDAFVGKEKLADLSPGAKIGTSSSLRKESIQKLFPNFKTVEIRGTIEERLQLIDQGVCDGIVVASAALKRLGLSKRITDIFPWDAWPLQGQLAIVGRSDDHELRKIFSAIDVRGQYGLVTLVGAGPGDPELITLKGVEALKKADCVFYDYLVHEDVLRYAPMALKINVGKRKGEHSLPQSELSKMLREKAMAGKNVVRLKGGDPLIFGRGADEITYLKSYHIHVDVVPGVSSATGLPSSLGIPLTARGVSSSVAFVSGHAQSEVDDTAKRLEIPKADTIVFLMGLTKLELIVTSLKRQGWNQQTPVMVISKGSRLDEKIVEGTMETIEQRVKTSKLKPPALIVVSETIKFWQRDITRAKEDILYLGTNPEKYKALGHIIHFPMIEIRDAELESMQLSQLKAKLDTYQLIILTSRFAVIHFFNLIHKFRFSMKALEKIDFAVIGKDTQKALEIYDIDASVVASTETSEGLLNELTRRYTLKGKTILFPRSSLANPYLKDELLKRGSKVDEITVYRNTKPVKRDLPHQDIKNIFFTSPSTVRNFLEDYGRIPSSWRILSKGAHTQKTLADNGYQSEVLIYE